ncbi:vWA domain-containing protein [Halioxenophilus sp. WMMB6]|uniref:vWA domain-containing protein n=1 Tax=Halioxenophilus sp. WMMB6 TaxID=3073815 RepID=UPI00295ECF0C|nr:vWA domain-containing protein [Halioxenophilus sp. WMMB6]
MKIRSREINVFSMSALDLFASALGAFMLLAIMALPFFPNTGDSPELVAEVRDELEQAQKDLEEQKQVNTDLEQQNSDLQQQKKELEDELEEQKRSTSKVSFPTIDIVIALDTTASMDEQVAGIRTEIVQLADLIMNLSPDAAMGIIDFKDRCEPQGAIRSLEITPLTDTTLSSLQNFANTMKPGSSNCNQDVEEAVDLALNKALAMRWRPVTQAKTIIIITDNPTYADKVSATFASASRFHAQGEQNQVSTVFVNTGSNANGKTYLERLAREGGGKFVTGGGSFTATILLALAE